MINFFSQKAVQNDSKCLKYLKSKEPNWFAYELCLKQIDFEYFVQMLRPEPWRVELEMEVPMGKLPCPY